MTDSTPWMTRINKKHYGNPRSKNHLEENQSQHQCDIVSLKGMTPITSTAQGDGQSSALGPTMDS